MNKHPLAADFSMYYAGTYIFRQGQKGYEAMLVDQTEATGDDTRLDGFVMIGRTFNSKEDLGVKRWPADQIINFRPTSGYYDVGRGQRDSFITFAVNNRTQRKGIDTRNIIVNGGPAHLDGTQMVKLFEQAQGMDSRPGQRDLFVDKSNNVHWKGAKVASVDGKGKVTMAEQFKQFEEIVCRLLQSI